MKSTDQAQLVARRLARAPREIQVIVAAEIVEWEAPAFRLDRDQNRAVERLELMVARLREVVASVLEQETADPSVACGLIGESITDACRALERLERIGLRLIVRADDNDNRAGRAAVSFVPAFDDASSEPASVLDAVQRPQSR